MNIEVTQVNGDENNLAKKFTITESVKSPFGPFPELQVNYTNNLIANEAGRTITDAENECPLAHKLLSAGVHSIMIDQSNQEAFITVNLRPQDTGKWAAFENAIKGVLEYYIEDSQPIFTTQFQPDETQDQYHQRVIQHFKTEHGEEAAKVVNPILVAIKALSPYVKDDGGNLQFKSMDLKTNEVYVEMTGACMGCSQTGDTLGNIQKAIKKHIGLDITVVNTAQANKSPSAFQKFTM